MDNSTQRWPDFLLIGAAKAGTTALFKALTNHPLIHSSGSKEPRFFSYPNEKPQFAGPQAEANKSRISYKQEDYLDLFVNCESGSLCGEASTQYLADPIASATAGRLIPKAKLLAILRHPVERAYSQYLHMRQEGVEPAASFEQAWLDNDRRQAENWRPAYWHQHRGFYARQITGWLEHFPPQHLLILFYEDWCNNPHDVLSKAWRHLGVPEISNPKITRENVSSRQPRWAWLHHRMTDQNNPIRRLAQRKLPLWTRDAITTTVGALNLKTGPALDPSLRARLALTYHDDISQLEALTGRDLTAWRK
jgi:hypothetical protein